MYAPENLSFVDVKTYPHERSLYTYLTHTDSKFSTALIYFPYGCRPRNSPVAIKRNEALVAFYPYERDPKDTDKSGIVFAGPLQINRAARFAVDLVKTWDPVMQSGNIIFFRQKAPMHKPQFTNPLRDFSFKEQLFNLNCYFQIREEGVPFRVNEIVDIYVANRSYYPPR